MYFSLVVNTLTNEPCYRHFKGLLYCWYAYLKKKKSLFDNFIDFLSFVVILLFCLA